MRLTKFAVSALAGFMIVATGAIAIAQDVVADPAIATMTPDQKVAQRQAEMKEDGGLLRGAGKLTGADASAAADKLIQNLTNFHTLFSEDTKGAAGTEALPIIWDQWDQFAAILDKALEGAKAMKTAAVAGDADGYAAALKTVGGTCAECHDTYRGE